MKAYLDAIDARFRAVTGRSFWRPGAPHAVGPLADFHRVADGADDELTTIERFTLLGVDDAASEKAMMDKLALDEAWPMSWWTPAWHPFASDFAGQLLVVDADSGRVIEFIHDDDARTDLAASLTAWFADVAARLDDGRLVVDAKRGVLDPAQRVFAAARAAKAAAFDARAAVAQKRAKQAVVVVVVIGVLVIAGRALGLLPA